MSDIDKRKIIWGGIENTEIPQMAACGKGDGGADAKKGKKKPKKPKKVGGDSLLDKLKDWMDDNKDLLKALAVGAVAAAVLAGIVVAMRKNRKSTDEKLKDLDSLLDGLPPGPEFDRTMAAREALENEPYDSGVDADVPLTELKDPPDYIGQQAIVDGDLYVYKDPPGMWVNFGPITPRFNPSSGIPKPITVDYSATIREVHNQDSITTDKTWNEVATAVGNIDGTQPNLQVKFPKWYVETSDPEDLYTYLRYGKQGRGLIINRKEDKTTYTDYPNSIIYKLYEPLPDELEEGEMVYVTKELSSPYEEVVQLVDFVDEDITDVVLRNPKIDSNEDFDGYFRPRGTSYRSKNDILTNNTTVANLLENQILSGSFQDSIELDGLEFRQFDSFIKFSSAEDRVKNFKYKLQLIEQYESQSLSFSGINGTETANYTSSLNAKATKLKNEFTPFEHFMYYGTSSYVSNSLGEFHNNSWPKKSGTGTRLDPYVLYPVTESTAVDWYTKTIDSASLYDRANQNRLVNNIPNHIKDDVRNDPFITFINMTGEHFDKVWTYIDQVSQIYDRKDGLGTGLSRDLIWHVGRSFGFYLNDGQDLVSLPEFYLGADVTGSDGQYSIQSETPQKDISREIWKRIVNNMPFFLKSRGTIRGLKGLINCYGIPSSILRVREYGGPKPPKDTSGAGRVMVTRKFTKAIEFKGGQYVSTTWVNDTKSSRKPDTVEFRFRIATGSAQTLVQAGSDWGITVEDNNSADNYGTVKLTIGSLELSSDSLPIYDGEFYSVMMTRMSASIGNSGIHLSGSSTGQLTSDTTSQNILYSLHVGRYDAGLERTIVKSFTSASTKDAATNSKFVGDEALYIGGKPSNDFARQMSGSMMEFRYWTTALNSGSFDNHTAAPKAFDGNHISASWHDLTLRYSFDDDSNLDVAGGIRDTSANQTYTQGGTASGYTLGNRPHFRKLVDQQKAKTPNLGPNNRMENKIRIEKQKLLGSLSIDQRQELSAYDAAPVDSNKLGVYFSPADVINEDIILSVGGFDYDDYLGDPRDKYKLKYRGLDYAADQYWKKYNSPNNFWDYIRLIRFYDTSVFDQIRKMIPARANANVGLLIEPNILERDKVIIGAPPLREILNFKGEISETGRGWKNIAPGTIASGSGETLPLSSSIGIFNPPNPLLTLSGSYPTYTGSMSSIPSSSGGKYLTFSSSIEDDIFRTPALYQLSSSRADNSGEVKYGRFKIETGGPEYVFNEVLQPNVSGSTITEHNQERRFFYTTQASASVDNYHSSSLVNSDKQSLFLDNQLFRLSVGGCVQTKYTTLDKLEPVTVVLTSPTTLKTKEGGESKLKVL